MTISAEALKPCPFCGAPAQRTDFDEAGDDNFGGSIIECTRCQASTAVHFDRKENLCSSWNDRERASGWFEAKRSKTNYWQRLEARRASKDNFNIDPEFVIRLLDDIEAERADHIDQIWRLLQRAEKAEEFVDGLLGLCQLIAGRDDVTDELRDVLKTNHRVEDARKFRREQKRDKICERCQGNGEIVADWDRYIHPRTKDVGDEVVAECPDCDGTGRVPA